jgi:hypothetical protein
MPNPIEPSPMTATRGVAVSGMRRFLDGFWLVASGYHGLAALPKRETTRKTGKPG